MIFVIWDFEKKVTVNISLVCVPLCPYFEHPLAAILTRGLKEIPV